MNSDYDLYKKESRLRDSPPAAGHFCDIFHNRRSAIPAERFLFIGRNFLRINKTLLYAMHTRVSSFVMIKIRSDSVRLQVT